MERDGLLAILHVFVPQHNKGPIQGGGFGLGAKGNRILWPPLSVTIKETITANSHGVFITEVVKFYIIN